MDGNPDRASIISRSRNAEITEDGARRSVHRLRPLQLPSKLQRVEMRMRGTEPTAKPINSSGLRVPEPREVATSFLQSHQRCLRTETWSKRPNGAPNKIPLCRDRRQRSARRNDRISTIPNISELGSLGRRRSRSELDGTAQIGGRRLSCAGLDLQSTRAVTIPPVHC